MIDLIFQVVVNRVKPKRFKCVFICFCFSSMFWCCGGGVGVCSDTYQWAKCKFLLSTYYRKLSFHATIVIFVPKVKGVTGMSLLPPFRIANALRTFQFFWNFRIWFINPFNTPSFVRPKFEVFFFYIGLYKLWFLFILPQSFYKKSVAKISLK